MSLPRGPELGRFISGTRSSLGDAAVDGLLLQGAHPRAARDGGFQQLQL